MKFSTQCKLKLFHRFKLIVDYLQFLQKPLLIPILIIPFQALVRYMIKTRDKPVL